MSELKLCPLRSSSKGNCTIVFSGDTRILVDCGISGKALEECLSAAGLDPKYIDAILITHEHSDHIKGVGIVSRKYNIPIYANLCTWQAMKGQLGKIRDENIRVFETGTKLYINSIEVNSFHTSHDAAESVGYVFEKNGEKVAIATDMGRLTDEILDAVCGSHTALIEANYDENMLDIGPYPYELKRRIKGDHGHLCNDASGQLARFLAESGTKRIFLGHLSEENNFPQLALKTVENCLSDCVTASEKFRLAVITKEGRILES